MFDKTICAVIGTCFRLSGRINNLGIRKGFPNSKLESYPYFPVFSC